ncbi:MAG: site-specific integrase [Candidatus Bathyarchaeota archaeon]
MANEKSVNEPTSKLNFLKTYSSKKTVQNYRYALKVFFRNIYGEGSLGDLAQKYFDETRDYEKDLQDFLASIKNHSPKTVNLLLSSVRTFLLENGVELPQLFWKRLRGRVRGSRARTEDKVPSNIELKKIIRALPLNGQALFLTLTSSGMRIGECLQLQLNDIDLLSDPAKVTVRAGYSKSGNSRTTFISSEAKEVLQEWLKNREDYFKTVEARSQTKKDPNLIFPFSDMNARYLWNLALKKSSNGEKDANTGYHLSHPYVLRKFFRSKMATLIPVDIVEALMGHEGYLTEVYRRYSVEDLAEFYKKGESSLHIFTNGQELSKLKVEIEEKNKQLQTIVNGLATENMELKDTVKTMKDQLTTLQKHYEDEKAMRENTETAFNSTVDTLLNRLKKLEQDMETVLTEEYRAKSALLEPEKKVMKSD